MGLVSRPSIIHTLLAEIFRCGLRQQYFFGSHVLNTQRTRQTHDEYSTSFGRFGIHFQGRGSWTLAKRIASSREVKAVILCSGFRLFVSQAWRRNTYARTVLCVHVDGLSHTYRPYRVESKTPQINCSTRRRRCRRSLAVCSSGPASSACGATRHHPWGPTLALPLV